jgi:hypothetical protein
MIGSWLAEDGMCDRFGSEKRRPKAVESKEAL